MTKLKSKLSSLSFFGYTLVISDKKRATRTLSLGMVVIGLLFLLNASWPIISYELFASSSFKRNDLISPIIDSGRVLGASIQGNNFDSTNANSWFVGNTSLPSVESKVRYYNISVPKLKIKNAVVEIAGENLKQNLVQYKGTALPGQIGNAVIFGHSALPQFYSPSNYLTIFTKLPTLKKGDDINIDYDGIKYHYVIEEMFEVEPTDIEVLAQKFDDSYLTLITCVPPGTLLRRLVVRARISPS